MRDHIVDVGRAGDVDGKRLLAVEVVTAAPTGRALHLPLFHVDIEHPLEDVSGLAEHDSPNGRDGRGQPPKRIDQRASIRLRRSGLRVQARLHPDVGLFEHLQLGLARTPQQRAVGPGIELHRVPAGSAIGVGIDESHCGYYPARFRKPAGDRASLVYIF